MSKLRLRAAAVTTAVAISLGGIAAGTAQAATAATPASATTAPAHPWRNVPAGSTLNWNQSWTTPSGRTVLTMQSDGNLVLYKDGAAVWASWTVGTGHHLSMQGDGNLVVYNWDLKPVWSSGTAGSPGAVLSIQEGNMAIFQGDDPLWYTNFPPILVNACQPYPHHLCP